ncbi:MAG: hypothetical protein K9J84_15025, partial [Bacteroidia bacterium]|nr:hypothetical protein [Bacteroidia bacterium]
MKKLILSITLLFLLFFSYSSKGQALSGTYTIDGTSSTSSSNFATFTEAISALNLQGADTFFGVVFEVASGQVFNERPPAIVTSGGIINPIIFKKTGSGTNPVIKPSSPGTLTVSAIGGFGDGVIRFAGADNIHIEEIDIDTNASFTTASQVYDYGYMLLRKSATDGCKNITIKNCSITNYPGIIHTSGIFSGAFDTTGLAISTSSEEGRMENILIKGNTVKHAYHAIQIRGFNHSVSPNNFYDHFISIDSNTVLNYGGLTTEANGIYTIYIDSSDISYNTVTNTTNAATTYGIRAETGLNSSIAIKYNSISITSTSGTLYPILNNCGGTGVNNFVDIGYNKIFNCSTSGSSMYGMRGQASAVTMHIHHNELYNLTNSGTGAFYVIWSIPSGATQSRVFNNSIYNITTSNTSNNSTLYPFICNTTTGSTHVFNNQIHNITHLGSGTGSLIISRSNAANFYCYNNMITNLKTPNSTGLTAIRAIELNTGANQKVLFNTVYLDASSGSTTNYGNACLHVATGVSTAEVRNNILVNMSTAGATGGVVSAYSRSSTTLTSYDAASNNNCFYVDTTLTRRAIFTDGTNILGSFAAFQTLVGTTRDNLSVSVMPPFSNISTAPYDLTLSSLSSPVIAAGSRVTLPNITDDIFGNVRDTVMPDMGAFEASVVLPVELLSFTAIDAEENALLNWTTVSETNNNGFYVERSFDGLNFSVITFVKGAGNSTTTQNYSYTDLGILATNTDVYYRLKQVDFDGTSTVSHIRLIKGKDIAGKIQIGLYPNPFVDGINLSITANQMEFTQLQLIDLS